MQSNAAKIGVAVASVAAIVVLFVVFSGSDDEDGESTQAATVTETTTEAPTGDDGASKDAEPEEPAKPPKPEFETIVVVDGEPKGGVAKLDYKKGDRVRLAVESDIPEEIHVHGYDLYEDITPGKKARVSFPAEIDGVFEIELHGTGAQIAQLTVKP